jgi:hypothetical protein
MRTRIWTACVLWCGVLLVAAGVGAEPPPPAAAPAPLPIRELRKSAEEWRALLAGIPALSSFATGFTPLHAAATREALQRGRNRAGMAAWSFVDGPFSWQPTAERSYWIVSGAQGNRLLIAVLEPGPTPKYLASAILIEPAAALAIGFSASEPRQLLFTTCFGCAGQGGSIQLDQAGKPKFVYR